MRVMWVTPNNRSVRQICAAVAGIAAVIIISSYLKCGASHKSSIILITVDTLRADHLSCYGYERETSPRLDHFAKEAMLFENCLSHAPETRMSLSSLMTGFLPHETKVLQGTVLPPAVLTLSEILRARGYRTMAVVSNFVLRKDGGWEQGFEIYDDTMNDLELVRQCPERIAVHTTNRAIELLEEFKGEKIFLWVHYQDPHGPYTPPRTFDNIFKPATNPYRTEGKPPRQLKLNFSLSGKSGIPFYQMLGEHREQDYYISQYDAEIRYMDEQLGRLLDTLRAIGFYDSSLIIFTADHGESMGEHDYYFAHGEYLYTDQIHVPLVIKQGKTLSGRRTDLVQLMDVTPTVLGCLGMPADRKMRGRDIRFPINEARDIYSEMRSMFEAGGEKYCLVHDHLKLIYTPGSDGYELYDLKEDPAETHNVAREDRYQEQFDDLKGILHRTREEDLLGPDVTPMQRTLSDEEKIKLRSLGYIE